MPALLLGITICIFWKILLTGQYTWLNGPDFAYQVAPWLQMQALSWHHWHIPLWDPYLLGGQSLIGQAQPGVASPFNFLLFLAPMRHGYITQVALHWYYALIHFFAALFCYALCRDLKRSRTASVLAAVAFAFAGWFGTTEWPQMLNGAIWAPLVLLFTLRTFRGESPSLNALLSGACLGISFLSGHHQVPMFVTVAIAGLWIYYIARPQTGSERVRSVLRFAAVLVATFCTGAVQMLPAYSYGHDAVRWVGAKEALAWSERVPFSVTSGFALAPSSVLGFIIRGVYTNSNPFVGITIITLALCGIAYCWKSTTVRLLGAMTIGGLLLAFANLSVLYGVLYAVVPDLDKARSPAMAIVICQLGICPLAAFGLDALMEAGARMRRIAVPLLIFGGLLWTLIGTVALLKPANVQLPDTLALTALAAVGLAALLVGFERQAISARAASVLIILLALVEFGTMPGANWASREQGQPIWDSLSRDPDIAAFLRAQGLWRAELNDQDIPYNFGDWYGIETLSGYVASMPERTLHSLGPRRAKAVYGVKFFVGKTPPRPDLKLVTTSAAGINVFESLEAMPRIRTVHQATQVSAGVDVNTYFDNASIDLNQTTFGYEQQPALESCTGDDVRMVRHDTQRVTVDADMRCRGMVIMGDAWSKDWTATVDGNTARVFPAYNIVRGVVAEAGHHRIELRYRPVSVYAGAMLSVMSLIAIGVYATLASRRLRRV